MALVAETYAWLLGLTVWIALWLPVYAVAVFGGLGLVAAGRRLVNLSDRIYDVAHVEAGKRAIGRV